MPPPSRNPAIFKKSFPTLVKFFFNLPLSTTTYSVDFSFYRFFSKQNNFTLFNSWSA